MRLKITAPFFLFLLLIPGYIFSQSNDIKLTGKVIEQYSGNPVEFATVIALDPQSDAQLNGTTTNPDGSFSLNLNQEEFYVQISFIGFTTITIREYEIENNQVILGEIAFSEDSEQLDEVVVEAERSTTEFKLDKRVFNVGTDLSSTGASALEVLNNVPSVNVNIEGQVSLRGSSGVQILINGKPSVLASEEGNALGTITADMIESVEVITNPSAKYDAEGTAGILNIVLKKEEKKGLNGSASLNVGIPDNHSFGMSMNRRTDHFNLFSQIGVGYRSIPENQQNINRDLTNNTSVYSAGNYFRNETFYNLILGTDYHLNDFNVLTLSGHYAYEVETQPSFTNLRSFDSNDELISEWKREEETEAYNPKYHYEFQYKRDFRDHEDHDLLFNAMGDFFGKDQSSEFRNTTISGDNQNGEQRTHTNFKEAKYTFKLDYVKPFNEVFTLESGAQYVIQDVGNDYSVSDYLDNAWIVNQNLTNIFEYDQKVLGIYSTGAIEGEKIGIKLGLRVENTNLNTYLVNTDTENHQDYTNFFPSAHSSYKLNERFSLQAGYSRRIFRPRLWDLNPFFNIRNNFNIRTGNPNLQPEFTDSYEVAAIYILEKASFNFGVYHRYTTDLVERVATFENNVSTTIPLNIGTNNATGIEVNAKYNPIKWATINSDFNFNYFNRVGSFEERDFDFTASRYSGQLTSKLNLPHEFDLEITGNYESGFKTFQSQISDNLFADLGVRKKILKGKLVLSFSIRDVFASRIEERITDQSNFYIYSREMRGRFMMLGISYGFGKGEAMEFSGTRRH